MSWINKVISSIRSSGTNTGKVPEGLWIKCDKCHSILYKNTVKQNLAVCLNCNNHLYISARDRLINFLDPSDVEEIANNISANDPLNFKDLKRYKIRLDEAEKNTNEQEALVVMKGKINEMPVIVAAFEFKFMGGSMGSVVGEKFIQATKISLEQKIPFICFSASGGARMQESLFSLMQMARTVAAIKKLNKQSIPYISVMTNPTYGGVSASLATIGDINIAEPGSKIGFAGPRVIKQTVREDLPEGFQTSEFLKSHGLIDMIIDRREMKDKIFQILSILYLTK